MGGGGGAGSWWVNFHISSDNNLQFGDLYSTFYLVPKNVFCLTFGLIIKINVALVLKNIYKRMIFENNFEKEGSSHFERTNVIN